MSRGPRAIGSSFLSMATRWASRPRSAGAGPDRGVGAQGQTLVMVTLFVPLLVGLLAFSYALASIYGAQNQADSAARAAALTALSTINRAGGAVTDAAVTATVNRVLLGNGYATVAYTTTSAATAAGVADLNGVYKPSGAALGALGPNVAGTNSVVVALSAAVHLTWGTLGAMTFGIHACTVASNSQSVVVVTACP